MTYRVMLHTETGEIFAHTCGFRTVEDADEFIFDIMDQHPECGFSVEAEEVYAWVGEEEDFEDIPF